MECFWVPLACCSMTGIFLPICQYQIEMGTLRYVSSLRLAVTCMNYITKGQKIRKVSRQKNVDKKNRHFPQFCWSLMFFKKWKTMSAVHSQGLKQQHDRVSQLHCKMLPCSRGSGWNGGQCFCRKGQCTSRGILEDDEQLNGKTFQAWPLL